MALRSIAELQLERDGLRALAAKAAYTEALDGSAETAGIIRSGAAARKSFRLLLPELERGILEAVADLDGETQIHAAIRACCDAWLTKLAKLIEAHGGDCQPFSSRMASGARPRGLLTVSQWADKHRIIETGSNMPGKWITDRVPYLREPMDALSEHSDCDSVAVMKSVQTGFTELMLCWIGYIMHHLRNKDAMAVLPSLELRDRSFNSRLRRMVKETPVLRDLIGENARNATNREDLLEYGGGARLLKAGANSSKSLRSDPIQYIACDEVDEFPEEIPGSGDPMTLIEGRQTTFSRSKLLQISTPKLEHSSRIHRAFLRSDQRHYHVPCPHCGFRQKLVWGNLKFDVSHFEADVPEEESQPVVSSAWYECCACKRPIDEADKQTMLEAGHWVPDRPLVKRRRGYHINALYAPRGLGKSWQWLAQKWLGVQGDTAELQAFVNERLGEVWREQGDQLDASGLIAGLERFPEPLPPGYRTIGCDVQTDRVEATIVHWCKGEEAWLLDHEILPGDTARPEVWAVLDDRIAHWKPSAVGVDAGFQTSMVLEFCGRSPDRFPLKGRAGAHVPLVEDIKKISLRLRQTRQKRSEQFLVGTEQGKSLVYSRARIQEPGPGRMHFALGAGFDDEYFAQLSAERLVKKARGGRVTTEWVKTRARNEALDCLVYALAAIRLSRIDLSGAPAAPKAPRGPIKSSYLR